MPGETASTQRGRPLSSVEIDLISRIVAASGPENVHYLSQLPGLRVVEMNDGKMGSVYILHPSNPGPPAASGVNSAR